MFFKIIFRFSLVSRCQKFESGLLCMAHFFIYDAFLATNFCKNCFIFNSFITTTSLFRCHWWVCNYFLSSYFDRITCYKNRWREILNFSNIFKTHFFVTEFINFRPFNDFCIRVRSDFCGKKKAKIRHDLCSKLSIISENCVNRFPPSPFSGEPEERVSRKRSHSPSFSPVLSPRPLVIIYTVRISVLF